MREARVERRDSGSPSRAAVARLGVIERRVNAGFLLVGLNLGRQARRGPEGPLYPDTPTREPL